MAAGSSAILHKPDHEATMDFLCNVEGPTEAHGHDGKTRIHHALWIHSQKALWWIDKSREERADTDGRQADVNAKAGVQGYAIKIITNVFLRDKRIAATKPHTAKAFEAPQRGPRRSAEQDVAPPAIHH